MDDITDTLAPKSDQLDAVDLLSGPRTFTITKVVIKGGDQPADIHLAEFDRPWRPNKNTRRVLAFAWGSSKDGAYEGRRVTLFCDPDVEFGGSKVGGVRVSHMSDLPNGRRIAPPVLIKKGRSAPYVVDPLPDAPRVQQRPTTRPAPGDDLLTAFNQAGITDKTDRLRFASKTVGRELASAADLTPDETARVVAALKALTGGAA